MLSDWERNSMTKSGYNGTIPFFSVGVRLSQRSRLTQEASGERLDPLESLNPVEESKASPSYSCISTQLPLLWVHIL